jgi:uncharacterized membrane protein YfcA
VTAAFSFVFLYLATRDRWLDLLMGIVFLIISARMIIEGLAGTMKGDDRGRNDRVLKGSLLQKASIGSVAGVLPGLLGIGTGVILVPAFTYVLGAPMKVAIASSLTCFSVNAFISAGFKYWQGFTDLMLALPMCLGALIGANLGAVLSRQVPSTALKCVFGIVFSYVSVKFMLSYIDVKI